MDKPKPRKHEPHKRDLLDRVLVGASEEAKAKILEILNAHDIEPDDPMFLALVAVTDCRMAVAPIPQELAALTQNLQAVLEELRERVKTSQDSQEIVLRKHQNLANDFCSTTEELTWIIHQKLKSRSRVNLKKQIVIEVNCQSACEVRVGAIFVEPHE